MLEQLTFTQTITIFISGQKVGEAGNSFLGTEVIGAQQGHNKGTNRKTPMRPKHGKQCDGGSLKWEELTPKVGEGENGR